MVSFDEVRTSACTMPSSPAAGENGASRHAAGASSQAAAKPFDLLRWFSVASLLAVVPVATATAIILSHFVTAETIQRDATLTAQFIRNCVNVEAMERGVPALVKYLDERENAAATGLDPSVVAQARAEVFDYFETLPEAFVTTVYAIDGRIIWSTNKSLVGETRHANEGLAEAIATRLDVVRHDRLALSTRAEFEPTVRPEDMYIENYVPLTDAAGKVVSVVEVDKRPGFLLAAIHRAQVLVWMTTLAGGVLIYIGLSTIVRRGARLLNEQQRRLVEAESQLFVGEMATALAHSLRNPLASVRSSAELALCSDDTPVRKNAQDIITQVDFLSQWIRELLLYSRPHTGDVETVDLCAVLRSVLESFAPAFERAGVTVEWDCAGGAQPLVEGNTSLVRQALHSVISNAVEAMPRGGQMKIELKETSDVPGVDVLIADTGVGMSSQQLATAFLPFHTSKSHGLGVGLPMLKRAMEHFGGFVTVASAENAGTKVRLHFRT